MNISASSINELERELPSLWLVYHLIMKTAKVSDSRWLYILCVLFIYTFDCVFDQVYLYDCTAVSPYALLFFGDKISTRQVRILLIISHLQ